MKTFKVQAPKFSDSLFLAGFFALHKSRLEDFQINKYGVNDERVLDEIWTTYAIFREKFYETTIENVEEFFDVNLILISKYLKCDDVGFELRFKRLPDEWKRPSVFRQYKG